MRTPGRQAEWSVFGHVGPQRKKTVTKLASGVCNCKKMGSGFERKQKPRIGVKV
jgi:hypothetical protein